MTNALLEFIQDLFTHGISWGGLLAFLIFLHKIQRASHYKKWNAEILRNQREMMNFLGVGDKWAGTIETLWNEEVKSYRRFYFWLRKEIHRESQLVRRKSKMNILKALTSSLSKKLAAFVITAGVSALNTKLGLNIDPNAIYGLYALTIAYIVGQSHVDAKKAISSAVNASAQVFTASASTTSGKPIQTIVAPPMSYQELIPYINDVHTEISNLYNTVKSGKYDAATQEAVNVYMTLHDYLKKAGDTHASTEQNESASA